MNTDRAIITSLTQNFWDDFLIAYDSIKKVSDCVIYVAPLDFDTMYLDKLNSLEVKIIGVDEPEIQKMKLTFNDRWVQWSKPYIIKKMVMTVQESIILWLDVDLVVLNSLDKVFEKIEQDFLVISDYFAPKSCLNDKKLYEIHAASVPQHQEEIALNSGVVGFKKPRDLYILNKWLENSIKVEENPNLIEYIRLYDQGVLLWSMRELGIIDKILPYSLWNHKAKRNCYEYSTPSGLNKPNFKWPTPDIDRIGGHTIDEVRLDNPGATIAHFAGLPKLSHLCQLNNKHSTQYISNKFKGHKKSKLFCVGLERCGTHTIAEIIRRGSLHECWVKHEFDPVLAKEVELKLLGERYWTPALDKRMEIYNREDVFLMSESNHRLGFFIPDLLEHVNDPKFLLVLRDPINLIRSRLRNYSIWARDIDKLPDLYKNGMSLIKEQFDNGSIDQNIFRIKPHGPVDLIGLHAWEIETTLKTILYELHKLPDDMYSIIWIENLPNSLQMIEKLIPGKLNLLECKKWASFKFGSSLKLSNEIDKWIECQVEYFKEKYLDSIIDLMRDYKLIPPFMTYI